MFESFYNAVRQDFIELNKRLSEQELDRYLKSEVEPIKDDYK